MTAEWHSSSHSSGNNECVGVRETPDVVSVRDTQNRRLGHIDFPAGAWKDSLTARS
ncbi:hypothetical protein GCM10027294_22410 [Marinactinospora endophytica]